MLTDVLIMDKNIGIIAHVSHESTCLSAAMIMALSMQEQKVVVVVDEEKEREKGIRPSFKEIEPFIITNPYSEIPLFQNNSRAEIRKKERSKQKIKNKYLGKRNVFKK